MVTSVQGRPPFTSSEGAAGEAGHASASRRLRRRGPSGSERVARWWFAALVLLVACIPGRHPVEGKPCDRDHVCPDGLLCRNLVCVEPGNFGGGGGGSGGGSGGGTGGGFGGGSAQACPNNLLRGGGFEDGAFAGMYWSGQFTAQGATIRSGAFAARITASSTLTSQLTAITPMTGADHCAEAWVRAAPGTGAIGLQLGRLFAGTDLSAETTVTPDGTWQKLTNRFAYPSGHFGMTIHVNAPAPDVFVDDVCVQVCP